MLRAFACFPVFLTTPWGHKPLFLSKNQTNNVYPCKPQFYYIKMGFKGVKIIKACFRDASQVKIFKVAGQQSHIGATSKVPLFKGA